VHDLLHQEHEAEAGKKGIKEGWKVITNEIVVRHILKSQKQCQYWLMKEVNVSTVSSRWRALHLTRYD
jgi:hypothetical protein